MLVIISYTNYQFSASHIILIPLPQMEKSPCSYENRPPQIKEDLYIIYLPQYIYIYIRSMWPMFMRKVGMPTVSGSERTI